MYKQLYQTIQQYALFPTDTTIVLAVSGGADSLALLHACARLRSRLGCAFHVATLDHGLRSAAADDVAFVRQMAAELDMPCTAGTADVPAIAIKEASGIEAAARRARYEFLAQVARQQGATHIATAHHADDQTETILMHLLRGAGIQGATGMDFQSPLPYHPELTLVRPLLSIRRSAIDAYCTAHDLVPRIDETNFDTTFSRNAIRHEILPYLRRYNPQIDDALIRFADIATVQQAYIREQFQQIALPHIDFGARVRIPLALFRDWHPALQRYTLYHIADARGWDVRYHYIQETITLIDKTVGAVIHWSGGIQARRTYTHLIIEPDALPTPDHGYWLLPESSLQVPLQVPGITIIDDWQITASSSASDDAVARLALLDNASAIIRARRPGDRFQPLGMGGHSRKLKDIFIDRKIPQPVRDRLPLIEINETLAAVILPDEWLIAELFAVHESSVNVFYFSVNKVL